MHPFSTRPHLWSSVCRNVAAVERCNSIAAANGSESARVARSAGIIASKRQGIRLVDIHSHSHSRWYSAKNYHPHTVIAHAMDGKHRKVVKESRNRKHPIVASGEDAFDNMIEHSAPSAEEIHDDESISHNQHESQSNWAPVSFPIYQTATFAQQNATTMGEYDYTRSGNPTRTALQRSLAALENAEHAYVFTSGMAALTILSQLLKPQDAILANSDMYGGTVRLLSRICSDNHPVHWVDLSDLTSVQKAFDNYPNIKIVMAESPTNPLMRVLDLRKISAIAHANNALLSVDGTMMSPYLQRPLELGADIVMHSATKFISGHSDVMSGVLLTNRADLAERIAFLQNATGNALAPFDCWLLMRGMQTLAIRMEQQQKNAHVVANYLKNHPFVMQVNYVGLASHSQYELHSSQSKGSGAVLSFQTKSVNASVTLVNSLKLFKRAVSFGSVTSCAELPLYFSHASVPHTLREQKVSEIDGSLIRLSCGIEHPDDLLDDLKQALKAAEAVYLAQQ